MPAAAGIAAGVVSTGFSIYEGMSASKRAREIQNQINNYKRQDLVNPNLSLQVSTLGADRQREDLARTMTTVTTQAGMGGSRAMLGILPNMVAQQNAQEAQIMANLDEQEKQRQQLVAQGDAMVQQMQEQREQQDLAGLGNALNTARHERINAYNNALQAGLATASLVGSLGGSGKSKTTANTTTAQTTATPAMATVQNQPVLTNSPSVINIPRYYNTKGVVKTTPNWLYGMNGQYNFLSGS